MIAESLSAMGEALAPALGNHLWQSTVFAIAAGLLTLILRKNHARTRYGLWLTASVKFLIPFSLLAGVGSQIAWWRGSARTNLGVYVAIDQISQPFSQSRVSLVSEATPAIHSAGLIGLLPALMAAGWLCGIAVVVLAWYVRWRRISAIMRKAMPLRDGREVESLRRLEGRTGMSSQIEMLVSRTSLEPGVFGIVRPILVWPHGISERLENEHLEAILAHELCHVRRRDNLSAAIHMVVEAIFWFHPMVWWLGAWLLEERERACDEQVLEMGSDRQVYAESILKICEFCVGLPLDFVSGVTGADLKKRIVNIMSRNAVRNLDFSRKLLLSAAGLATLAVPVVFGMLNATRSTAASQPQITAVAPTFSVVSIKANRASTEILKTGEGIIRQRMVINPGELTATGNTLQTLIGFAYGVKGLQIFGGPSWLNSEIYDVEAKADESVKDELHKLSPDQRNLESQRMVRALLADRFKLTVHREIKELPVVYSLVIAKSGLKLREAKPGDTYPEKELKAPNGSVVSLPPGKQFISMNQTVGHAVPVANLVDLLSGQLGRIVLDRTGLTGKYNWNLEWAPDSGSTPMSKRANSGEMAAANLPPSEPSAPSIFTAIQEQLGLKLEPQKGPVEVLIIDHVEKPAELETEDTGPSTPSFQTVSIKVNKTGEPMGAFSISGRPAVAIAWKSDRFMATNFTLSMLIRVAYDLQDDQITGGPSWLSAERYDIDARMDKSTVDEVQNLGPDQGNLERIRMMQALIADQFRLSLHRETRELPVYELVIAKNGPKIQEAKPGDTYANGVKGAGGRPMGGGGISEVEKNHLVGQGVPLQSLVRLLSQELGGRTVVDKTGLAGKYDFSLQWAVDTPPPQTPAASYGPSIFTAVQDQLGLKLESTKRPVDVFVIDRAEKPSEN
jgi:bla regulator protein BlaR1